MTVTWLKYYCIILSSKDTYVKLWDLDTCHCFQTLVDHRSEVWAGELLRNETRLVTASSDIELRVYDILPPGGQYVMTIIILIYCFRWWSIKVDYKRRRYQVWIWSYLVFIARQPQAPVIKSCVVSKMWFKCS